MSVHPTPTPSQIQFYGSQSQQGEHGTSPQPVIHPALDQQFQMQLGTQQMYLDRLHSTLDHLEGHQRGSSKAGTSSTPHRPTFGHTGRRQPADFRTRVEGGDACGLVTHALVTGCSFVLIGAWQKVIETLVNGLTEPWLPSSGNETSSTLAADLLADPVWRTLLYIDCIKAGCTTAVCIAIALIALRVNTACKRVRPHEMEIYSDAIG